MELAASRPAASRSGRGRRDLKGHGFDLQAKRIIRDALVRSDVSHEELVRRLARIGVHENVPNIRNKLTRGRFTASFLLQIMAALGVKTITLEATDADRGESD